MHTSWEKKKNLSQEIYFSIFVILLVALNQKIVIIVGEKWGHKALATINVHRRRSVCSYALYESVVVLQPPLSYFGSVGVWVAFISPVLALACLHAICPCGPQQSKAQTDLLTQPRGHRVTILWIQFSRLFSPLHGPSTDEARQLMLQTDNWRLSSLAWSIDILGNFSRAFTDFCTFTVKVMFKAWGAWKVYESTTKGHKKDTQRGKVLLKFLKRSIPRPASP